MKTHSILLAWDPSNWEQEVAEAGKSDGTLALATFAVLWFVIVVAVVFGVRTGTKSNAKAAKAKASGIEPSPFDDPDFVPTPGTFKQPNLPPAPLGDVLL